MKANRKLTAATRVKGYLEYDEMRISFKAFFKSQFNCCPLTWMFRPRTI